MSKKPILIFLSLGVLALALFPYWDGLGPPRDQRLHDTCGAEGNLSVTVTENGMLESSNNEEIKCMVKGGSTVLWVIETGTFVKPGDELVRLDTSLIEDNITQQKISYERAVANQIIAQSEVDVAKTNIDEYLNGTYIEEGNTLRSKSSTRKSRSAKQLALSRLSEWHRRGASDTSTTGTKICGRIAAQRS